MASTHDAMISILYVMENMNTTIEMQVKELVEHDKWEKLKSEKLAYLKGKIRSRLEDFCTEMESEIDSCRLLVEDIIIVRGNPAEEILKASDSVNADMIVMGNHGYNVIQDVMMGGTARKVVKSSKIPVLIVKLS